MKSTGGIRQYTELSLWNNRGTAGLPGMHYILRAGISSIDATPTNPGRQWRTSCESRDFVLRDHSRAICGANLAYLAH